MRRLVFDLADAVYDEGDALRVRFGTEEERIALGNIINISFARHRSNPQRGSRSRCATRALRQEVSFSRCRPSSAPLLRTTNPIVSDLIERADVARRR